MVWYVIVWCLFVVTVRGRHMWKAGLISVSLSFCLFILSLVRPRFLRFLLNELWKERVPSLLCHMKQIFGSSGAMMFLRSPTSLL